MSSETLDKTVEIPDQCSAVTIANLKPCVPESAIKIWIEWVGATISEIQVQENGNKTVILRGDSELELNEAAKRNLRHNRKMFGDNFKLTFS